MALIFRKDTPNQTITETKPEVEVSTPVEENKTDMSTPTYQIFTTKTSTSTSRIRIYRNSIKLKVKCNGVVEPNIIDIGHCCESGVTHLDIDVTDLK